jgi:hypothetical protein
MKFITTFDDRIHNDLPSAKVHIDKCIDDKIKKLRVLTTTFSALVSANIELMDEPDEYSKEIIRDATVKVKDYLKNSRNIETLALIFEESDEVEKLLSSTNLT